MDTSVHSLVTTTHAFTIILLIITLIRSPTPTAASSAGGTTCYNSIISLGDSLADTGNLLRLSPSNKPPHFFLPPYGETYFHHPTGRCSNGRLVIDFIAELLGLPLVPPYLAGKDVVINSNGFKGVNFAVAGATALDISFFRERGIANDFTNNSLGTQLGWLRDTLQSLCQNSSGCSENILRSSLVLVGEIGGNDYNNPLQQGRKIEEIRNFVAPIVHTIGSAIEELIKFGAVTLIVPGNLPIGCLAVYLSTYYQSANKNDYDRVGCLKGLNNLSKYHNNMLQTELDRIRKLHPHATIIYADYYNAVLRLYDFPQKYGFEKNRSACCGGGGPYNYNSTVLCGYARTSSCRDPSLYVCWDGQHLTEAAYSWIAHGILQGPFSTPPFNTKCLAPSPAEFLH